MPRVVKIEELESGIYLWRNLVNGKVYVGSAKRLLGRMDEHRDGLDNGRHFNVHFQRAYWKYGREAFRFRILERCSLHLLIEREQYWIDMLDATNPEKGYNICPVAGSTLGIKLSEETRAKMRAAHVGRIESEETIAKRAASNTGKKRSEESRKKMSEAAKGKPKSEEHKANLRKIRTGWVFSEETRKKIGDASRGRRHSAANRRKIKLMTMGRPWSVKKWAKGKSN